MGLWGEMQHTNPVHDAMIFRHSSFACRFTTLWIPLQFSINTLSDNTPSFSWYWRLTFTRSLKGQPQYAVSAVAKVVKGYSHLCLLSSFYNYIITLDAVEMANTACNVASWTGYEPVNILLCLARPGSSSPQGDIVKVDTRWMTQ